MRVLYKVLVVLLAVVVWSIVKRQLNGGVIEAGIIGAVTVWAFNAIGLQKPASRLTAEPGDPATGRVENTPLDDALPATKAAIDRSYSWRRLFARLIDYQISALILMGLVLYTNLLPDFVIKLLQNPNATPQSSVMIQASFSIGLWTILEPLVLKLFNTTPGKALLGLQLVCLGSQPKYFTRSLAVWGVGMGFGIPLVTTFASLIALGKMKVDGRAIWDKWTGFTVEAKPLGGLRRVTVTLVVSLIFANRLFQGAGVSLPDLTQQALGLNQLAAEIFRVVVASTVKS